MRLASLMFASLLVLVFGIATLACGGVALAQTRAQVVTISHALDGQTDPSQQTDVSADS